MKKREENEKEEKTGEEKRRLENRREEREEQKIEEKRKKKNRLRERERACILKRFIIKICLRIPSTLKLTLFNNCMIFLKKLIVLTVKRTFHHHLKIFDYWHSIIQYFCNSLILNIVNCTLMCCREEKSEQ